MKERYSEKLEYEHVEHQIRNRVETFAEHLNHKMTVGLVAAAAVREAKKEWRWDCFEAHEALNEMRDVVQALKDAGALLSESADEADLLLKLRGKELPKWLKELCEKILK